MTAGACGVVCRVQAGVDDEFLFPSDVVVGPADLLFAMAVIVCFGWRGFLGGGVVDVGGLVFGDGGIGWVTCALDADGAHTCFWCAVPIGGLWRGA